MYETIDEVATALETATASKPTSQPTSANTLPTPTDGQTQAGDEEEVVGLYTTLQEQPDSPLGSTYSIPMKVTLETSSVANDKQGNNAKGEYYITMATSSSRSSRERQGNLYNIPKQNATKAATTEPKAKCWFRNTTSLLMCITVIIFVLLTTLLSVAALVLAVVKTEHHIQEIETKIQGFNKIQQDSAKSITEIETKIQGFDKILQSLSQNVTRISTTIDTFSLQDNACINATHRHFAQQQNCTTTIEATCSINPTGSGLAGSLLCETGDQTLNITGSHVTDIACVHSGNSTDVNPLAAIASFDRTGTKVRCLCAVIVANAALPQIETVSCGIRITRCTTQQL